MIPKRTNPLFLINPLLQKFNFERSLFFLVILFLPTQLGRHFWPEFSYIYSLKIDYLSPTIYLWDIFLTALIITWVLKKPYVNKNALICVGVFLISQILSLLNSQNQGATFIRLEQFFLSGLLGIYISSQNFLKSAKLFYTALIGALLIESWLSIIQFLNGGSVGLWILGERSFSLSTPSIANFNFYGKIFLRPYGTFSHPNVLAGFITIALPLLVLFGSTLKNNITLKKIGLLSAFIAGFLTFSRVSILLLIVQAFIYLKQKKELLMVILIIVFPIIFTRFNSAFNFDNLSFIRREELAQIALIQFKENPLFGSGLNNFINEVASSSLISGPSRFLQPVHNIFLLSLAETGILGFVGFLVLLGTPLYKLWLQKNNLYAKCLFTVWGSIILLGMFDHYFLTLPQGQRLLFFVWGLSMLEYSNEAFGQGLNPHPFKPRAKKNIHPKRASASR